LASGIGQAIASWAAECTHRVLENDPKLRKLQECWRRICDLIAGKSDEELMRLRRLLPKTAIREARSPFRAGQRVDTTEGRLVSRLTLVSR
jgi:hypothetical protein